MALKRYSKKEPLVFLWIMTPYVIFLNMLMLGNCIFRSVPVFIKSFLSTGLYLFITYFLFGLAALFIQKRFPGAANLFKRIAVMLPVFYLLNLFAVPGIFYVYDNLSLSTCPTRPSMLLWTILYGCLVSTIITFINEGLANWEAWKASLTETEKLRNLYQQSKVLGLKGQINPHFLFNCFNTLSGLIQEDETKAEIFLDEMTKVHRYLLRSDNELLVPLEMEIKFARSWLYLAKARFGDSIQSSIRIDENEWQKTLPPLTMQVILENIIYTNALSKTNPLMIDIYSGEDNELVITNSIQEKIIVQDQQAGEGLSNLFQKYNMLHGGKIMITEKENRRILTLPLFNIREVAI